MAESNTPVLPRDDDAAPDPQTALTELIHSTGWTLLLEHVRREYGNAAQIRRVRDALETRPAAEHSVSTQSILGTAEAIIRLFAWPEEEIDRLRKAASAPMAGEDRFAQHRRVQS